MRETTDARPRRRAIGPRARALLATAALVACARPARATDTYTGPSGNWSAGSNWSLGAPPGNKETVVVQGISGGNNTITFDAPAATATNLTSLSVGAATNIGSTTLLQSAGSIVGGTMTIGTLIVFLGSSGVGNVSLSGGQQTFTTVNIFGSNAAGVSTFTLSGSGQLTATNENVGLNHVSGTFVQNAGTNTVTNLNVLGPDVPATVEYDMNGGTLKSPTGTSGGTLTVSAASSTALFNQTGGSTTFNLIQVSNNSRGTFKLSGGSVTAASESVYGGGASFAHSAGANNVNALSVINGGTYALSGTGSLVAGTVAIGDFSGDSALFTQSGGTATLQALQFDGGALAVNGGVMSINSVTRQNVAGGGGGKVIVSGGQLSLNNANLDFGFPGGTMTISGGVLSTGTFSVYGGYFQTGGTHSSSSLSINGFSDSYIRGGLLTTGTNPATLAGTFHVAGGTVQTGVLTMGGAMYLEGTGVLNASELEQTATLTTSGNGLLNIANDWFMNGSVNLSATSGAGSITVGGAAYVNGTFMKNAGAFSAGGLLIGDVAATGAVTLTGTALISAGSEDIGYARGFSTSTFTQTGSSTTNRVDGTLSIGTQAGASGSYTLNIGTLTVGNGTGTAYVGNAGQGTFQQNIGSLSLDTLYLGFATGSTGTYTIKSGQLAAPLVAVGNAGRGTFTLGQPTSLNDNSSGTVSISQSLIVGALPTATGACTVSGKSLLSAANVYLGGDASGPGGTGTLTVVGGTTTISGTLRAYNTANGTNVTGVSISRAGVLSASSFANDAPFTQSGGSATFGPVSGSGSLTVSGTAGAVLAVSRFAQSSLSVGSGGTVRVLADPQSVYTNTAAVTLTGTGTLDLNNHDLLTPTPTSTIQSYLALGYNGGAWNGTNGGIVSTAAANSSAPRGLAYATATDFTARNVPAGQTLVTYTVPGDADLSGAVDFNDFLSLQNGYGSAGDWAQGDFNYDGVVDYRDYLILQADYGLSLTGGTPTPAPQLAVPEPASLSLLGLTATALLARRRRSRQSLG